MAFKKKFMARRGRKARKQSVRHPRKKSNLTKLVKAVIRQQSETKQAYITTGDSLIKYNSGINSLGDYTQVLPNITQGTADNARIGDQIRAQSLTIRGYIKMDPILSSGTFNNQGYPNMMARLMVVSLKTKANFTEATSSTTPLSGLLKKGGTTSGFTGVLSDIYAPINTDLWTVHADRKMYVSQDIVAQYGGQTTALVAQDLKNTVKFFTINVKCKNKLVKYDANISSNLLPTNFGPILLVGYAALNGDSPDVISARLGLQFDAVFNYEDA